MKKPDFVKNRTKNHIIKELNINSTKNFDFSGKTKSGLSIFRFVSVANAHVARNLGTV